MAENPRTTSARDHDDTDLIEGMIPAGDAVAGSSGGALQRNIGSQDDLKTVDDPDGTTRPEKQDDIAANQARRGHRGGAE